MVAFVDLFSFFHFFVSMSDMLKGFILRSGICVFGIFIKSLDILFDDMDRAK